MQMLMTGLHYYSCRLRSEVQGSVAKPCMQGRAMRATGTCGVEGERGGGARGPAVSLPVHHRCGISKNTLQPLRETILYHVRNSKWSMGLQIVSLALFFPSTFVK